jgi:hypothetical protein
MSGEQSEPGLEMPSRRAFMLNARAISLVAVVGTALQMSRDTKAAAPVWTVIPDQTWVVGQPVNLDLRNYCSDADANMLTFVLSGTLPPGVTINSGVISGTPTAEFAASTYVAFADDGQSSGIRTPNPPTNVQVS